MPKTLIVTARRVSPRAARCGDFQPFAQAVDHSAHELQERITPFGRQRVERFKLHLVGVVGILVFQQDRADRVAKATLRGPRLPCLRDHLRKAGQMFVQRSKSSASLLS
jgi:hypothetical protein